MISIIRLALTLTFCVVLSSSFCAQAQENSKSSGIIDAGKKATAGDLRDPEPTASFPKSEIEAMAKTGKSVCTLGTTFVHFDATKGLSLAGESLSTDELIKRVTAAKNAGKISCLVIDAASYDKRTFDRLEDALVEPKQISLVWNVPDPSK